MVITDMARTAAAGAGVTPEQVGAMSVTGMLAVVDRATKEAYGGKIWLRRASSYLVK
jgi:norsolorinic acid ketoreductase